MIDKKDEIKEKIVSLAEKNIKEFNLNLKPNFDNLEIFDTYSEEGYKKITPKKIEVINDFFRQTGILFDPTYTGKAFYAYNENFLNKSKNNKVIFLHTGGIFGTFPKRKNYLV